MADGLVTITVELQDGSVVKGVADMKNQFAGFDGVTKKSGLSMAAFGAVTGAAMAIAAKAFDTVKQSIGSAVSRFDTLNQFPKVMKQMGYSAEDTAVATKVLKKGIDGLPTSLSEITKSAQSFSILTGSAEKGAKTSLALNDAFLASGASAEDASRGVQQYSQMLSSGKVDMMSWRTLLETMPYSLNEVAKSFGFTGKAAKNDLYNALQNGTITMDQLNDKFIELDGGTNGFAKTARVASEGIKTSFTNMNNAMVAGLANTLKAIDDGLKNAGLPGIAQMLNDRKDQITKTFKIINGVITASIPPIVSAFRSLFNFINANKDWIYPLVVGIATGVTAFTTLKIAMQIGTTVSLLVKSIKSGVETMQILWMIMMDNPIILLISVIAALVVGLTYFFTKTETGRQVWAKFTAFLQSSLVVITTAFQNFMSVTNEVFQSFKVVVGDAFSSFVSFISPAITAIQSWLGSLQPVSGVFAGISGPMGIVIGLVEKFGPLIISMIAPIGLMGKLLLQFAAAFIQTGNASSAITLMASNFTELVVNVLNGLTTIINGLTAVLPSIVEAGVNIITSLINGLLGALPQIIDAATQIITMLVSAIGTALPAIIMAGVQIINMLVQAIATALPQLVEAGVQIINMLVQSFTAALPMIIESAVTIMTTLLNGIIAVLPLLIGAGLQIIMALGQALIAALPALIDAALQIIMALVNALIVNLPQIINAGIQLLMALINGLITVLPLLINAAIQIITALVNGLIQNLPKIIEAAVKLITALINGLIQNLPAIISAGIKLITALAKAIIQLVPLLLKAGIQLIAALIKGILSLLGQIMQAGVRLVSQMLSRIGGFVGRMGSMGGSLIRSLISGISGMIGNVASTVSRGVSRAVSAVRGFAGDMASAAGHMANGLVNGITGKINAVVNAAKNMARSAVNAVKSFLNIHSPSRVMRDEVGKYIPLGMAAGIDRNADAVDDSMKSLADQVTDIKPSVGVDFGIQAGLDKAKQLMKNQRYSVASNSNIELSNATKPERPIEVNNHFDNVAINDERDIKTLAEQLAAEQTIAMRGAWG